MLLISNSGRWKASTISAIEPALYTLGFFVLILAWNLFELPQGEALFSQLGDIFRRHGLWIVGVSALIEGLVLVNLYFPGSAVIAIAVIALRGQPAQAAMVVGITAVAFVVAAQINFLIGYYGVHALFLRMRGEAFLDRVKLWHARFGKWFIPLSFFHPNFGAFVAVACGKARYSPTKFMSLAASAILFWNTVWGLGVYSFSSAVQKAASNPWFILVALLGWTLVRFILTWSRYQTKTS